MPKSRGALALAAVLTVTPALGVGCGSEGPAERMGEQIDESAERAKEKGAPEGPAENPGEKGDRNLGDDR